MLEKFMVHTCIFRRTVLANKTHNCQCNFEAEDADITISICILNALQDSILYIYKNTEDLPSARVCGIVFQGDECSKDEPSLEWSIDIDPGSKAEDTRIENRKAQVRISLYPHIFIN